MSEVGDPVNCFGYSCTLEVFPIYLTVNSCSFQALTMCEVDPFPHLHSNELYYIHIAENLSNGITLPEAILRSRGGA
jgi:hypothetical protein